MTKRLRYRGASGNVVKTGKKISVQLDNDVFNAVEKASKEQDLSFSNTVNRMLRRHLTNHKRLEKAND